MTLNEMVWVVRELREQHAAMQKRLLALEGRIGTVLVEEEQEKGELVLLPPRQGGLRNPLPSEYFEEAYRLRALGWKWEELQDKWDGQVKKETYKSRALKFATERGLAWPPTIRAYKQWKSAKILAERAGR